MEKKFGRALLGYNPAEVASEIQRIDAEYRQKEGTLQVKITAAEEELIRSRERIAQLEKQLNTYIEREHIIAEVMLTATNNACRIEEEARERARAMEEKSAEELREKVREFELLRMKVERFKTEFKEILDRYKFSLEEMKDLPNEKTFSPTIIVTERKLNTN